MRKKAFSSFDVATVVHELQESVLNSRVSNVYQLGRETLLFKLRKVDKSVSWLVLEAGRRLHLTSYAVEKPKLPPSFCMALRKYLRNSRLTGVKQHEFERVVAFTFDAKTFGKMQLFLELFGDGNIILVSGNHEILQALSYRRMRDRNVLRGETFRFAPSTGRDPFKVSNEELSEKLRSSGGLEVVRALARLLSIGGFYSEEVLLRANVDKKTPCNELNHTELEALLEELQRLLDQVRTGKFEPCIVLDESGDFVDVTPLRLRQYASLVHEPYENFNMALDEVYARITAVERKSASNREVEKLNLEAERLRRVAEEQKEALVEAKADRNKRIGDTIYVYSSELQALLERFSDGKKKGKDLDEIVSQLKAGKEAGSRVSLLFESYDSKSLTVKVYVENLRFGLNLNKGLFQNAARFYERAKKARRKSEGARAALEKTQKNLALVEAEIGKAEAEKRIEHVDVAEEIAKRKIRRKRWFEKFRWFVSSEGLMVVAGKDAVSNEVLVKKYTKPKDIVFHADIAGAPFVVVKTGSKKAGDKCLREAGEFAAAFSKAWREGFASVDVYWVKPDQLSKGGGSGEHVPRGAFMIRGKRQWLRGVPLKIAVGVVVEEGDEVRFIGGPVDAVKTETDVCVIVVPGDLKGKVLLNRLLKRLAGKMPGKLREKVLKASIEEIRMFIPYSRGRILEDSGLRHSDKG